ncbi:MAG TPA: arylamine N-acetyltransferase [Burkholderiaceae bacterium]|nr:arylamine N-acetyltransferase [Burkholderiaceae bacterium]
MSEQADLEGYLDHIGYAGPQAATREALDGLIQAHTRRIPFENLNPLLGWPVRLDLASLARKFVREGRGGFCYEHNLWFAHVLRSFGFPVTGLAARVVWRQPDDAVTPRTHMLLCVDVRGERRLADVGFGAFTVTSSLALDAEGPQPSPHESFRVVPAGREYLMQVELDDSWRSLYRFDLQPQEPVDYELTSWYLCHHPQSHFRQHLIAARAEPGVRLGLLDGQLSVRRTGLPAERTELRDAGSLRQALKTHFFLDLPADPAVDARLEGLLRPG